MLAYPLGANHGGSALTFALVVLGSVSLWRQRNRALLALCWLPFGLNCVAAMMHKYPFGDSARITLHLAPFICILMADGLSQTLDWLRGSTWQWRVHLAIYVILLCCGAAGLVRDFIKPYKTEHDRDVRQLARDIRQQVAADEPVLLGHTRDEEMIAEFVWYLRTQSSNLHWQSAGVDTNRSSYWLIQCSNQNPGEVVPPAGWTIASSEMRFVRPENAVRPPLYCRWIHFVRAGS
jgi:hypothetical protein